MSNEVDNINDLILPALPKRTLPAISELVSTLNIPSNILAQKEEIEAAWSALSRELKIIPIDLRNELIAKMCVAVSVGLFDGALNYIWNAAILQLRQKIRNFGLAVVSDIIRKDFEENHLLELQDSQLLELCLKLNIIDEDGYFFLDQCRSMRNNFSAAHPAKGTINDREFIMFLNRCVRYALAESGSLKGINIGKFISAIKGTRFKQQQLDFWKERLLQTHDAQRQLVIGMVHGIYCDSAVAEQNRLNSLDICCALRDNLSNSVKLILINNHTEYVAKGLTEKHTASSQFFEKLGLLSLLNQSEQHSIFYRAVERLWNIHNNINNFYNEPPFAEYLLELSKQIAIPETVQENLVKVIACCTVGNGYGVSNAAVTYYHQIIQSFSPKEIAILVRLATDSNSILFHRLKNDSRAQKRLKAALLLIDPNSVPKISKNEYDKLIR